MVVVKEKHSFGFIELDALINQKITLNNVVSQHPLETGEILSDAIYNEPIIIELTGVVTDLVNSSTALQDEEQIKNSKSLKAWSDLFSLWKSKTLIEISSTIRLEAFENMAILKIEVEETNTFSLKFKASLQEIVLGDKLKNRTYSKDVKSNQQPSSIKNGTFLGEHEKLKSFSNTKENTEVKVDYNETHDYYFYNVTQNGELIQGDKKLMNAHNTDIATVTGQSEIATAETVGTFTLEVF